MARTAKPAVGLNRIVVDAMVFALLTASCAAGASAPPGGASAAASPSTVASPSDSGTLPSGEPDGTADGEPVRFAAGDGVELEGRRFGDGDDGVVLAHMRPASMESWFPFARILAGEGYAALAFNFRGYGASEGSGFAVDVDVRAAIDALLARGVSRVFVIGASMGGTGAIVASAGQRAVAGVITLSAPAAFEGVDALTAIGQVDAPIMLLAGDADEPYASNAAELQEASGFEAELILLAGNRHGTDLFIDHVEALHDTILGFLADPT